MDAAAGIVNQFINSVAGNPNHFESTYDIHSGSYTTADTEVQEALKNFDENMGEGGLEADVKPASISGSVAAAAWTAQAVNGSMEGTHVSASALAAKGEAYAEGYGGIYQVDPETGEARFSPGIGGSIGASFTAFTAEEEAQLGDDTLGVYAKTTQTAGEISAQAEGNAGLFDKEGNFNPSLYAGASMEAIAGEITGSVGAKILGADIGMQGSLNYGFGAHASAGYRDGKLSLDMGATLGVGGSVKMEIDVSGMVNAVRDKAKAVWNGLTGG